MLVSPAGSWIMPAATVELLIGSIRMKLPVERLDV